jgi:hypothetical protein
MTRSRKHHFVQQAHLRLFEDDKQKLTVGGKDGSRFRPTTGSIFAERDLYAYELDGATTSEFEDRLTEIENETFPALRELAHTRKLTDSAIPLICTYIATSFLRNPSQQTGVIAMHRHAVEAAMRTADAQGVFDPFPSTGTPYDGKSLTELLDAGVIGLEINNVKYLEAMQHVFDTTLQLVGAFELSVVTSTEGRIAIGDHPLTFLHPTIDGGPYGIPFGGRKCELTFPVSKHVCLIGRWETAFPNSDSARAVEQVNRRQVLFASKHVAVEGELGDVDDMLKRYANVSFKTEVQTLPLADGGAMMPTRRGLLPTSEWRKVRDDVIELHTAL